MTHTCIVCGLTSEVAEFYAGISNRCKECHKRKVRENRAANVERYRAYDAHRFQNDPRVKERQGRYFATPEGREALNRGKRKWIEQNPQKRACHVILNNALRDGRVSKPAFCSICGAGGRLEAHHPDYAYPLQVTWCCVPCHKKEHRP